MDEKGKYKSMYFMNNSGGGKIREIRPGEYFTIMQPNHKAVGDGSATYKHTLLFKDTNRNNLEYQVNEFLGKNGDLVDFDESNKLMHLISGYKKNIPIELATGRKNAEITAKARDYELPIAKSMRKTFMGPDDRARWNIYDNEPKEGVIHGNKKKASPLSYSWWY
ncbi:MAG: hypothetical protein ACOCZ6_05795 [Nanoarchaeota archaeon]